MTITRKEYATKRVARLKTKLATLTNGTGPAMALTKRTKAIASTKTALRRWLKEFPDIDPFLLQLITRM